MGELQPALTIFGLKNMAPDDYKDISCPSIIVT
jgi:hypothetical protein